jgi:hypothetical protein
VYRFIGVLPFTGVAQDYRSSTGIQGYRCNTGVVQGYVCSTFSGIEQWYRRCTGIQQVYRLYSGAGILEECWNRTGVLV